MTVICLHCGTTGQIFWDGDIKEYTCLMCGWMENEIIEPYINGKYIQTGRPKKMTTT